MNWVLASKHQSGLQEFHLLQNGDCKLQLKYNPLQHSARFISGDKNLHRLFYIESKAPLFSKTIFRDQYGMETASILLDKINENAGTVLLDGKKYHYRLQNGHSPVLVIYEYNPDKPWISCGLSSMSNSAEINSFIIGLGWYILQQQAKINPVEFAA
jgi:hypothetical protein